jgi:hypothetical protein
MICFLTQLAQLEAGLTIFRDFAARDLNRIKWLGGAKRGFRRVVPT